MAQVEETKFPEPGALARHAAAEYRKASRYPASSKALPDGAECPLRAKLRPQEVTARGGQGEVTFLTLRGAKLSYEIGSPVEFFVRAEGSEIVNLTGDVTSETGERVGTLHFFDDGIGADTIAGDGVFSARMPVGKRFRPELATHHRAVVRATFANGEIRHAIGGYLLSRPWARVTGRYRGRVADGHFVISVEIAVERRGRFHLAGTLESVTGEAIGTSQTAWELEPGRHWIDLSFYGLMFHERQVEGPYILGSLVLQTTGQMPSAISDLIEDAYTTHAVSLEHLTTLPAGDPELLKIAMDLEAMTLETTGTISHVLEKTLCEPDIIFADSFECGTTSAWDGTDPCCSA